ncbi:MAG: hypothetical protein GXX79_11660 [Actinomycetales bacterium]|nr:hypothetical protein [Actinomycetales bacterium]
MSDALAGRYGLLLRVYPARYREQWGDELLGTLMTRADAERTWPPAREATALVAAGLRMRLRANQARDPHVAWAHGLRTAVVILLSAELGHLVVGNVLSADTGGRSALALLLLAVLALVAAIRDRRRAAVLATLGWEAMHVWIHNDVSFPIVAAAVLLVIVSLIPGAPRRPLGVAWGLAVPATTVLLWAPSLIAFPEPVYLYPYQQSTILIVAMLCAAATPFDSQAAFVMVGLLTAEFLQATVRVWWAGDSPSNTVYHDVTVSWWSASLGAVSVGLLLVGQLTARRQARL